MIEIRVHLIATNGVPSHNFNSQAFLGNGQSREYDNRNSSHEGYRDPKGPVSRGLRFFRAPIGSQTSERRPSTFGGKAWVLSCAAQATSRIPVGHGNGLGRAAGKERRHEEVESNLCIGGFFGLGSRGLEPC